MRSISRSLELSVVLLVFGLIVGAVYQSVYVGVSVATLGIVLQIIIKQIRMSEIAGLAAACFTLGIIFVSFLYIGYISDYGEPYWMPGLDDKMLEQDAFQCVSKDYWTVYDMENGDTSRERQHNAKGYVIFLSYLMRLGGLFDGYHTLVPRVINIFALNLIGVIIATFVARRYESREKASPKKLYCALTLFPNMLYIASHVYRDILIALFMVMAYGLSMRIAKKKSIAPCIAMLGILCYCSYWFREASVVFMAAIIIVALLLQGNASRKATAGKMAFGFVCLIAATLLLMQFNETINYYMSSYGETLSSGDNAVVSRIYALPLFPFGLVLRIAAYVCTPYYYGVLYDPASWFSSTTTVCYVLVSIGTALLVSQYVYVIRGAKIDRRVFLIVLVIVGGIALTTYGYRHAVMVYPFLFMLLSLGKKSLVGDNGQVKRRYAEASIILGSLFVVSFGALFIL